MKILGFAGSLRAASYNKALLRAARELAPEGMEIEIFDIGGIPLYNEDVERAGVPAAVEEFRAAIRAADALLIAVPEYNHGVPGVLKNAIDWASRPPRESALAGKPAALLGASPGQTGTARAQTQMRADADAGVVRLHRHARAAAARGAGLPRARKVRRRRPPHRRAHPRLGRQAPRGPARLDHAPRAVDGRSWSRRINSRRLRFP